MPESDLKSDLRAFNEKLCEIERKDPDCCDDYSQSVCPEEEKNDWNQVEDLKRLAANLSEDPSDEKLRKDFGELCCEMFFSTGPSFHDVGNTVENSHYCRELLAVKNMAARIVSLIDNCENGICHFGFGPQKEKGDSRNTTDQASGGPSDLGKRPSSQSSLIGDGGKKRKEDVIVLDNSQNTSDDDHQAAGGSSSSASPKHMGNSKETAIVLG